MRQSIVVPDSIVLRGHPGDGQKHRVKDDFPPVELNRAPRYCTTYIREHADRLIRRFETWHNVNETDR